MAPLDDAVLGRLPLPLAQLYRRAHNAKTPRDSHDCALYLWEAGIKLLAAAAVSTARSIGELPPPVAERLQRFLRPSLGHWRELIRLLLPALANCDFYAELAKVLEERRGDLPRCAALEAALRDALAAGGGPRQTVRLADLLDRIVEYRNKGQAHAAPAAQSPDRFRVLSQALLGAAAEVFDRWDVLAGRHLVAVTEVRPIRDCWLIERAELRGVAPWRIASLEVARTESNSPPLVEGAYLIDSNRPGEVAAYCPLQPLMAYDAESESALFYNGRRGRSTIEFLCYATGRRIEQAVDGSALIRTDIPETESEASRREINSTSNRMIGDYELISELGRGAMGIVYRARQLALGRDVALKIQPRPGDAKADARFRREIRALARVDHAHLVKVYTFGVEGEQFYYTMEMLEGAPLDALCHALTSVAGTSTAVDLPKWQSALTSACEEVRQAERPLSGPAPAPESSARVAAALFANGSAWTNAPGRDYIRQIVLLISQVADAAHALHEAGVLHRDIKPGNIHVSPDGSQAVLLDLGLAQLADDVEGRLTRTTQFVGTRRYASPEQQIDARALDRRSDVYSLGATLWELLALRPLFGASNGTPLPVLIARVQRDEPERLQSIAPSVGRDLEAIVHKCLEKEPSRRYESARDLADDLRRWLNGEPVAARPVGLVDRTAKWIKRRPVLSGLTAALSITIVGSTVGSWFLAGWAREEAKRAREAAIQAGHETIRAQKERDRALSARQRTREALDAMTSSIAGETLLSQRTLTPEQEKFLKIVIDFYREFTNELSSNGTDRRVLVAAQFRLACIYYRLGQGAQARPLFEQAIQSLTTLTSETEQGVLARYKLVQSHNNLALILLDNVQVADAQGHIRSARNLAEQLVQSRPQNADFHCLLAETIDNMAIIYEFSGQPDQAEKCYREAIDYADQILTKHGQGLQQAAGWRINFSYLLRSRGKLADAEEVLLRARQDLGRLSQGGETHDQELDALIANADLGLGVIALAQNRSSAARERLNSSRAVWNRLYALYPGARNYAVGLGECLLHSGRLKRREHNSEESLSDCEQALRLLSAHRGDSEARQFLGQAQWDRVATLAQLGRTDEAIRALPEAIRCGEPPPIAHDGDLRAFFRRADVADVLWQWADIAITR